MAASTPSVSRHDIAAVWVAFSPSGLHSSQDSSDIVLAGCLQNPPPELLEQECERNTSFALALLAVLPVRAAC